MWENGVGVGKEKPFASNVATGFTLIYEHQPVHLTALKIGRGES